MPARATQIYGIDTSVLLRLLTGHPEEDFAPTVAALQALFEGQPSVELLVSNQVIGEAYVALQHHYKLSKAEARSGIFKLLSGGMLAPLNGSAILGMLQEEGGAGLMDRLIVQDYQAREIPVLTDDRRMSKLTGAVRLKKS
jgi:predicted nucleic-acid-binding protein